MLLANKHPELSKKFYSSPLGRALDTAKIASKYFTNVRIVKKEDLKEISHGNHDGMEKSLRSKFYTENDSKVGFWLRWLCSKFFVFTRALCSHNGRSLQTKNLRSRLAKFPTFESFSVYHQYYEREIAKFQTQFPNQSVDPYIKWKSNPLAGAETCQSMCQRSLKALMQIGEENLAFISQVY